MPKHRLESFSDGVFAIVITLLIPNVHLDRDQELTLQTLPSLGPEMLAFALTFVIVGVYWVSHHSMMHMIKAVDRRLLWLNLLLLLAVVFTGAVVPRPIGWASTLSKSGVSNLAPFSFFTVVCVIPPMISLTIARNPDGTEKHTLKNVRDTGEFCFNVVTEQVWREMVDSANAFPAGDSEFSETGLTAIPSVKIATPRVKEVPIHFECKLERVLELGPNRHPLVIGEVVYMHVDPSCMTNGYIDMKKLNPIGRLNGFSYATLGKIFEREFFA